MHLWMINHYALPATEAGGTRHYSLARELVSRGHQVTIIASAFRHARINASQTSGETQMSNVDGVQFVELPTPAYAGNGIGRVRNMLTFALRVLQISRSGRLHRPDIILGSSPHPFAALAARRIARRNGVPFVLEIRDLWPASLVQVAGASRFHPFIMLLGRIERSLYRSADAIVSVLPRAKEHIIARGGNADRIVWIPNGVDFSIVASAAAPKEAGPFTVMYTGAMGRANALDSLLDAAKHVRDVLPGIRFRFIGDGPERVRLQVRARSEGLSNVTFEQPISKQRIFHTLHQADVMLVSTLNVDLYRHGLSLNKLFDYLAISRPIVFGASCPDNPVLDAGAGFVVEPENGEAMASAIQRLYEMSAGQRGELGRKGRRYAEDHHDVKILAERLEGVCDLALASFSGTRAHHDAGESQIPRRSEYFLKRPFDFIVASMILIILSPVLGAISCAVFWKLGSPVLFRQKRPGANGRVFTLVKFRTMREQSFGEAPRRDDRSRLTPFGAMLRQTSLDEIPELWNVVRGEMSLVGPRPLLVDYLPLYSTEQARRHEVRPGITGWAQVNGRNTLSWDERLALDVWYVDHVSLGLDLRILYRTLLSVARREGINHAGEATMSAFKGSNNV